MKRNSCFAPFLTPLCQPGLLTIILVGSLGLCVNAQTTVYFSPGAAYDKTDGAGTSSYPYTNWNQALTAANGGEVKLTGTVHRPVSGQPLVLSEPVTLSAANHAGVPVVIGAKTHPLHEALLHQNPTGVYVAGAPGLYGAPIPAGAGNDVGAHVNGMARVDDMYIVNFPDYVPDYVLGGRVGWRGWAMVWSGQNGDDYVWDAIEISESPVEDDTWGKPSHMDGAGSGFNGLIGVHFLNGSTRIYKPNAFGVHELTNMRIQYRSGDNGTVGLAYHPGWDKYFLLSMYQGSFRIYVADYNQPWTAIAANGDELPNEPQIPDVRWDGMKNSRLNSGEGGNPFFHIQGNEFGILALGTSKTAEDDLTGFRATRVVIEPTGNDTYEVTCSISPHWYNLTPPEAHGSGLIVDPDPNFRWAGTARVENGKLAIYAAGRPLYIELQPLFVGESFTRWVFPPNLLD